MYRPLVEHKVDNALNAKLWERFSHVDKMVTLIIYYYLVDGEFQKISSSRYCVDLPMNSVSCITYE